MQVDGNDVPALFEVVSMALEKARNGGGPTLIEALTYRLHDHTTADDATRYRRQEELEEARSKEPIERLKRYLVQEKLWSDTEEKEWQQTCASKVEQAVQEYTQTAPASIDDMFDYLYADIPADLVDQRTVANVYAERHHD